MKRFDDLVQAATDCFHEDAALRRQIARELRDHLEDTQEAARTEGMNESQAEDAAVRAFGDPQEVSRKLWQANQKRLERRALLKWALLWPLIWAGIWILEISLVFLGNLSIAAAIAGFLVIVLISLTFLPRTARFGFAYLRWLAGASCRSARIAMRSPWIWGPAVAAFVLNQVTHLPFRWRMEVASAAARAGLPHQVHLTYGTNLLNSLYRHLQSVRPITPGGLATLLLAIGYIAFAMRIERRLQSDSGLDARHVRWWHVTFMASAGAAILLMGNSELSMLRVMIQQQPYDNAGMLQRVLSLLWFSIIPFTTLLEALYLSVVIRAVRGEPLSLSQILKKAFAVIWPLTLLGLISFAIQSPWIVANFLAGPPGIWWRTHARIWEMTSGIEKAIFLAFGLTAAFIPVIIICDQCGLGRALGRFGTFLWRNFWRYVTFIVLGALLLTLPDWLGGMASDAAQTNPLSAIGIRLRVDVLHLAFQLVLTVMCFEFYLARAGTAGAVAVEGPEQGAFPPLPRNTESSELLKLSNEARLEFTAKAFLGVASYLVFCVLGVGGMWAIYGEGPGDFSWPAASFLVFVRYIALWLGGIAAVVIHARRYEGRIPWFLAYCCIAGGISGVLAFAGDNLPDTVRTFVSKQAGGMMIRLKELPFWLATAVILTAICLLVSHLICRRTVGVASKAKTVAPQRGDL